jgi:CO dehydrogenase/acetyl-CoA synthase delta subunit
MLGGECRAVVMDPTYITLLILFNLAYSIYIQTRVRLVSYQSSKANRTDMTLGVTFVSAN